MFVGRGAAGKTGRKSRCCWWLSSAGGRLSLGRRRPTAPFRADLYLPGRSSTAAPAALLQSSGTLRRCFCSTLVLEVLPGRCRTAAPGPQVQGMRAFLGSSSSSSCAPAVNHLQPGQRANGRAGICSAWVVVYIPGGSHGGGGGCGIIWAKFPPVERHQRSRQAARLHIKRLGQSQQLLHVTLSFFSFLSSAISMMSFSNSHSVLS